MMNDFVISKSDFYLKGEKFRVVAGAMHYFRVPRAYWRDRLLKIKACGCNTVETYVAWNLHEPREGEFTFADNLNLDDYLSLIEELGMYAIVRPGPYICSEWEFGGLPWWLLRYDDMELRCTNERYLEKVDRWFDRLIPIIAAHQIGEGGGVIMVQVENEYGSYGDDEEYLRHLAAGLRARGIVSAELFTSDGGSDGMLTGGALKEIYKAVNFGSRARANFAALKKFQPDKPLMCAEFWNGWFDHWGEKHHTRTMADAAESLRELLDCGAGVSVYMMHGGTNFGFMNGANCTDEEYQPTVNSYDDDAPINEYGGLTGKYKAFQSLLASYGFSNDAAVTEPETHAYGEMEFTECADLLSLLPTLSSPTESVLPLSMEQLGQGYGFICYECEVRGPREKAELVMDVHDRAWVFADGAFAGIQYRNDKKNKIKLAVPEGGLKLTILVENMGRANYGPHMRAERKGLIGPVRLGNQILYHWQCYPLPLTHLEEVQYDRQSSPKFKKRPQLLRTVFAIEGEPKDTFVLTDQFKKGVIFVNGRILSRYWEKGPQHTAYLPAPYLKTGRNEIVLLELEGYKKPRLTLTDSPILDN